MPMKSLCQGSLTIDFEKATVSHRIGNAEAVHPLASDEGFALVSDAWLRAGWDSKYVYGFTWFGRPVIQLPEDLIRIQEIVWQVQPDVIIETGVAHGGGQIFFASLCKAMGRGRVIGIELELRPHNRAALETHPLRELVTLIDGSSTAPEVVSQVKNTIRKGESVLVILDSNHSAAHVEAELEAYAPLVTPGSYLVATDGIMQRLKGAPRSAADWEENNPLSGVTRFLARHPEFVRENPTPPFNEGCVTTPVTYWPGAYLKRTV